MVCPKPGFSPDSHCLQSADFPTTILDDEIELHEQNTPSLNTRPSKFSQGMEPNSSSRYFTIADDGDSFKEILPQFSSDPIEQSPPRITSDKCEGLVSRRVQKFESEGPRVDFRNMSLKSKMKNNTKVRSSRVTYSAF